MSAGSVSLGIMRKEASPPFFAVVNGSSPLTCNPAVVTKATLHSDKGLDIFVQGESSCSGLGQAKSISLCCSVNISSFGIELPYKIISSTLIL